MNTYKISFQIRGLDFVDHVREVSAATVEEAIDKVRSAVKSAYRFRVESASGTLGKKQPTNGAAETALALPDHTG